MIRYAAVKDKDALVQGLHAFVEYINKPKLFPEQDKLIREQVFLQLVSSGVMCTLVDEINGEVVGGIGLIITPYLWNPNRKAADELFWWCSKDAPATSALRLIRAAKAHCTENNIDILSMSMMYNSPAQVEHIYTKLGLEKIQSTFAGVFNACI